MYNWLKFFIPFILLLSYTTLFSQDQQDVTIDDLANMSIEELMQIKITSATKKPEEVKNIAANFIIISRQDIERMGYTTLDELVMNIPGFYHIDTYEDFLIGIRGGVGGTIAFLLNGVQHHTIRIKPLASTERARMNIPIESIDRIEIIKGPMSVIYGNNAFLGSINIVTNEASENKNVISVGNSSAYNADKFYLNDAFYRHVETYDDGKFVANLGWNKSNGINGKYKEMMSQEQYSKIITNSDFPSQIHKKFDGHLGKEYLNLDLSGNFRNINFNMRYSNMKYGIYLFTPGFKDGSHLDLKTFHANVGITKEISNSFSYKTDLTYSSESYDGIGDFFNPFIYMHQLQTSERLEGETVINYKSNNNFELAAGYRHLRILGSHIFRNTDVPGVALNNKNNDIYSNDFFVNGDKSFNQKLKLIAGIRWSRIEPYHVVLKGAEGDTVINFKTQNIITPRIAIVFNFDTHNIFKLMYGEATQNNSSYRLKEPEHIKTIELNHLANYKSFSISTSIFQNNISNLRRRFLRSAGDTAFIEIIDNDGKWETRGLEVLVNYKPGDLFDLESSFTWQHTKDKREESNIIANSPEYLAKIKASYLFNGFCLGVYLSYVDRMLVDPIEISGDPVSDYIITGANFSYKPNESTWFFKLHIFNLFDEEIRYTANELVDFHRGSFGPGREISLKIGYTFK